MARMQSIGRTRQVNNLKIGKGLKFRKGIRFLLVLTLTQADKAWNGGKVEGSSIPIQDWSELVLRETTDPSTKMSGLAVCLILLSTVPGKLRDRSEMPIMQAMGKPSTPWILITRREALVKTIADSATFWESIICSRVWNIGETSI